MDALLKLIHDLEIPLPIRLCLATDGSLTHLLEVLTGNEIRIEAIEQHVVNADDKTAKLMHAQMGEPMNQRKVLLIANDVPLVSAFSISALERMPEPLRRDIQRAERPIGKLLKKHVVESRRELIRVERLHDLSTIDKELSGEGVVREYYIIRHKVPLMWIQECFPLDERWKRWGVDR